jgi:hypothetical protein
LRAERVLPADDSEWICRPFQGVVVNTHEQPWRGRGSQSKPRRNAAHEE